MKMPRIHLGDAERRYVQEVMESGDIGQGSWVRRFEDAFSSYVGVSHGIAVNNGTSALHLALAALDIGPGDEVIVPSFTFISCANAVLYAGATPVFVDADPNDWNLDPTLLELAVTNRTKAIMPVHLFGNPCRLDEIIAFAAEYRLPIVEDAAEAHGAEYMNRKCGSFGTIGCFSFYGNKLLTTGEGGMCLTDDEGLMQRMRLLRAQAKEKNEVIREDPNYPNLQFKHEELGYNFRMMNLQAAIGLGQLERLDEVIAKKRHIAGLYREALGSLGLTVQKDLGNVYMLVGVLFKDWEQQNYVTKYLEVKGVDTRSFFYPMHLHTHLPNVCWTNPERENVAEDLNRRGLVLPNDISITDDEIQKIVGDIEECL